MEKNFDIKNNIYIQDAHLNNLKNIYCVIPKNKLVVITGVSGSGKSTLVFDTLYAEGQRRYLESLSLFIRQFIKKLKKTFVQDIKGLVPAIGIYQKFNSSDPRSTVGTRSEIYDYLRLLYARIGKTYSPISGNLVVKHDVSDVINFLKKQIENQSFLLLSPIQLKSQNSFLENLKILKNQGFVRLEIEKNVQLIDDLIEFNFNPIREIEIFIVIDRFFVTNDEQEIHRISDSVQSAFYEGCGICYLRNTSTTKIYEFSNSFSSDGIKFKIPDIHFFSFNNPLGACKKCDGYGEIIGIDENLVIPNKSLSIYNDAVVCWKGDTMKIWKEKFFDFGDQFSFPFFKPYYKLSEYEKKLLWSGREKKFPGIYGFFDFVKKNIYKIQYRVLLSRYQGKSICPDCKGIRLNQETENVKVGKKSLGELVKLPITELQHFFYKLELTTYEKFISKRLFLEIHSRINFLIKVGLNYLTLNRSFNTLSSGESQRINLATSLASSLVGSMYILDEPSIGLHTHNIENLILILKNLRDLGNTVVVVEHNENIIKNADYIIDIGPKAGVLGGLIQFQGTFNNLLQSDTLTAQYFNQKRIIKIPKTRRIPKCFIQIRGARHNNLKNIAVDIPLNTLTVITGVSGSGKSTLIKSILVPFMERKFNIYKNNLGDVSEIKGDFDQIKNFEFFDQNSIKKSSRSNPSTYIGAYDDIRELFGSLPESKIQGYSNTFFSFNIEGGRCENCKGEGFIDVSMQFIGDIQLVCESCEGKRFKKELLEIQFHKKNIFDILELTISEAICFFNKYKINKIITKLLALQDIGLGYLKLGQSFCELSRGELQRVKLASYLMKEKKYPSTLFVFDEPSTGLHFYDIEKLINIFQSIINNGHSIIIIEHHLDLIKCADYVIDLGPEEGKNGGQIIAYGTPEELIKNQNSLTGKYLKEKILN